MNNQTRLPRQISNPNRLRRWPRPRVARPCRSHSTIDKTTRKVVESFVPAIVALALAQLRHAPRKTGNMFRTAGRFRYERTDARSVSYAQQSFDESKHPRAPAGQSDGGQFIDSRSGTSPNPSKLNDAANGGHLPFDNSPLRRNAAAAVPVGMTGLHLDMGHLLLASQPGAGGIFNGGPGRDGHHWVPQSVWNALTQYLPEKVRMEFDRYKTDPGLYNHGFDTWIDILVEGTKVTHPQYNKAIHTLLSSYIHGLRANSLDVDQAKAFALMIGEGRIPDGLPAKTADALRTVLANSPDAWATVNKWRTGFWNSVGVGQWFLDRAQMTRTKAPNEAQLKIMIREVVGNPSKKHTKLAPVYKQMGTYRTFT